MKIFISLLFLSQTMSVFSDCGCEGNAYFHMEYIDATSNKTKSVNVVGQWWRKSYGPNDTYIYSNDKKKNARIEPLSNETKTMYFLNDNPYSSYVIVEESLTPEINTKTNGKVRFRFVEAKENISPKNILRVLKIDNLVVGCAAIPNRVSSPDSKFLKNMIPSKVKETYEGNTDSYMYKLGYELEDEYINMRVSYGYKGGCA